MNLQNIKKIPPSRWLRYLGLGAVFLYVTITAILHQQDQAKYPPVDALCPYGGLESLFSLIFTGRFLHRVFSSSLILLIITVVLLSFSGRSFCGWLCPFGTLQGIIHKAGGLFLKKRKPLSFEKDKKIRWLRYAVLIFFTIGAWTGGRMIVRPYDPWVAWMHLSDPLHALDEFPVAMILLLIILVTALFISRPFCRYLCPMGGFLGLLNKISPFKVKRQQQQCTDCTLCSGSCPMGIDTAAMLQAPRSECISCGECAEKCRKEKSLAFKLGKKSIPPLLLGIIVIVFFTCTILITQAVGVYRNTNHSVEELKQSGDFGPEQIKGYMTLREVSYLFELSLQDLYHELDLNPALVPPDTPCREIDMAANRSFETDEVRLAVSSLLDIPVDQIPQTCPGEGSTFIPGTMTLEEVSAVNNIPLETLYARLGLDPGRIPPRTACRDLKYLVNPNFHTTVVREAVAELLAERGK